MECCYIHPLEISDRNIEQIAKYIDTVARRTDDKVETFNLYGLCSNKVLEVPYPITKTSLVSLLEYDRSYLIHYIARFAILNLALDEELDITPVYLNRLRQEQGTNNPAIYLNPVNCLMTITPYDSLSGFEMLRNSRIMLLFYLYMYLIWSDVKNVDSQVYDTIQFFIRIYTQDSVIKIYPELLTLYLDYIPLNLQKFMANKKALEYRFNYNLKPWVTNNRYRAGMSIGIYANNKLGYIYREEDVDEFLETGIAKPKLLKSLESVYDTVVTSYDDPNTPDLDLLLALFSRSTLLRTIYRGYSDEYVLHPTDPALTYDCLVQYFYKEYPHFYQYLNKILRADIADLPLTALLPNFDPQVVPSIEILAFLFDEILFESYRRRPMIESTLGQPLIAGYPSIYSSDYATLIKFYGKPPFLLQRMEYGGYVRKIVQNLLDHGVAWFYSSGQCVNEDEENVETLEPHSQDQGVIFAYGTPYDYLCFTVEELEYYWSGLQESGNYAFKIPYKDDVFLNVEMLQSYVSPDSTFWQLIQRGLEQRRQSLSRTVKHYRALSFDDQVQAHKLWRWLVLIAMWVRYWQGSGHPFPLEWSEKELCELWVRDSNVQMAVGAWFKLLEQSSEPVKTLIYNMPTFYLDYNINKYQEHTEKLVDLLNVALKGKRCVAYLSDILFFSVKIYFASLARLPYRITNDDVVNFESQMGKTPVVAADSLYTIEGYQPTRHIEVQLPNP